MLTKPPKSKGNCFKVWSLSVMDVIPWFLSIPIPLSFLSFIPIPRWSEKRQTEQQEWPRNARNAEESAESEERRGMKGNGSVKMENGPSLAHSQCQWSCKVQTGWFEYAISVMQTEVELQHSVQKFPLECAVCIFCYPDPSYLCIWKFDYFWPNNDWRKWPRRGQ